jgi:hypothetical protein
LPYPGTNKDPFRSSGSGILRMICPYCKETIQDGAILCRYCGSKLTFNPYEGIIAPNELKAFIGPNSSYYAYQFSKFSVTGVEKFTPTWNWSCFGFTFIWMFYRKMYIQGVITFLIFCLPGINLLMHILAGIVGNYLYYRHVKDKIAEIRTIQPQGNLIPIFQEVGGVHRGIIGLAIILGIIIAIIFSCFFQPSRHHSTNTIF